MIYGQKSSSVERNFTENVEVTTELLQVKGSSHVWNGVKVNELHRLYRELLPTPVLNRKR